MKKAFIILVLSALVILFYWNNTLYVVDNNLKDRLMSDTRDGQQELLILGIDSESLNRVGQWPWSREVLADVTRNLVEAGAKGVLLDVLYTEKSEDTKGDAVWQQVVKDYNNVYMASYFDLETSANVNKGLQYTNVNLPIFDLPQQQIVHINTLRDKDRVVRKALLGIEQQDGEMMPAAGVRLANLMLPPQQQITWNQEGWFRGEEKIPTNGLNQVTFSYASSPQQSTIEVQPIYKVINGEIPADYFKDRVVLIGPYSVGMGDYYYTPMSNTVQMYGVEIHANIAQSLVDNSLYKELSMPIGVALLLVLAAITFVVVNKLKQVWAVLVTTAIIVIYVLAFINVYNTKNIILPFLYPVLLIAVVYIATIVFNYIAEQREKKRVTSIFGRYVSQSVVNEILATGEDIKVGGERKDITLMFVDIRGFTPLSEKMEPEEVIEVLNEYLEICTKAVFEYEGTIDKFMGDGVMVMFGAPIEQQDHALRAAKTALRLKENATALADRLEQRFGKRVAFGVGLNSGPAVVGNIGSKDRVDYTAIDDTVNLAARLSQMPSQIKCLLARRYMNKLRTKSNVQSLNRLK